MTFEIVLNIEPMSHQSMRFRVITPKNKKPFVSTYKPAKIVAYQKELRNLILEQKKGKELIPSGVPITVEYLHYCFAYPKSMPKKNRIEGTPKVTKPDLQDNLNKAFFDALEGAIFEQDQNIWHIKEIKKYYQETSCIKLKLTY